MKIEYFEIIFEGIFISLFLELLTYKLITYKLFVILFYLFLFI